MMELARAYAEQMTRGQSLVHRGLWLQMGGCLISVRSNSEPLMDLLQRYFSPVVLNAAPRQSCDLEIVAIERPPMELEVAFVDWKREPGKSGRKDSFYDLEDGRLIRKVRTGMVFLICDQQQITAGPCLANDNQVINFINAQYMSWLQQRDWLICHASGVVYNGKALAVAGFSGGGKSTLMLQTLENPQVQFLSNDRLFVRDCDGRIMAAGIPKLPRINPGTILNNPRLRPMLSAQRITQLEALPRQALWELEEKYDVIIDEVYGEGRICQQAPLQALLILNWDRDSTHPLRVTQVDVNRRRDLLAAVMKSPGPFYRDGNGHYYQEHMLPENDYLQVLKQVAVYEVTGGVNFIALSEICQREVLG